MLMLKNDNGEVCVVASAVSAVQTEGRAQCRILLAGGGSFLVHGTLNEIASRLEAQLALDKLSSF